MRNFKTLVWTDEFKPETSDPVLACIKIRSNIYYRIVCWGGNSWRYLNTGTELEQRTVKAWAYIPRCAFVYPETEGLDDGMENTY